MKIIKTDRPGKVVKSEKEENTEISEFRAWDKVKNIFTKNIKRNAAIFCTLVLIAGAVYLNWMLFSGTGDYNPDDYVSGTVNGSENKQPSENASTDGDGYFALAIIDRAQARAEALEVLSSITTSDDATNEAKENAYSEMAKIAEEIECEANIETLVKAKGFEECVVVIASGKASVIVSGENLLASEVAQIKEIVYTQASISPQNITIIEKVI
jgi:stage III sporulation protein AH